MAYDGAVAFKNTDGAVWKNTTSVVWKPRALTDDTLSDGVSIGDTLSVNCILIGDISDGILIGDLLPRILIENISDGIIISDSLDTVRIVDTHDGILLSDYLTYWREFEEWEIFAKALPIDFTIRALPINYDIES